MFMLTIYLRFTQRATMTQTESKQEVTKMTDKPAADRRDVPVGVPLDLSTPVEWHELPKYNGIQVSQLI